ncbi:MAG: ribonuclease III [Deltaproteobacteria bacterium]|nr:ribonuclease III [Deltaproteobacteria bacterium]
MNPELNGLSRLEKNLGVSFRHLPYLITALTHKSHSNENPGLHPEDNERQEFLGDSVLGLIISIYLYRAYPDLDEGALSKARANLVNETTLAGVARKIGIGDFLFLGKGEEQTGGREKDSLLSDALEAVIAGIYLDQGFRATYDVILKHFETLIPKVVEQKHPFDYKTTFQEACQERFGVLPEYTLCRATGPDHDRIFVMELSVKGEVLGQGSGKSKKEAQQQAARQALEHLKGKKGSGTGDSLLQKKHRPVRR